MTTAALRPPLCEADVGVTSIERLDPMAAYLREVQRHPLLTPEGDARARGEVRRDAGSARSPRGSSRRTCGSS